MYCPSFPEAPTMQTLITYPPPAGHRQATPLALLRPYARPSRILSFAPRLNVRARQVTDLVAGGDTASEEGGIIVDEAEQGRTAGVLPGQAHEVQAGDIGDPAPVDYLPVAGHARDV